MWRAGVSVVVLTVEDPLALLLRLVAVDARHRPAVALHAPRQVVRLALRLHEDQRLVLFLVRHVLQQLLQSVRRQ